MVKRVWLWLIFLILGTAVLGALAGFWNYTVVQNADLTNLISRVSIQKYKPSEPWIGIVFGSLGFLLICGFLYYIFFKLLAEIKINQAQAEFLARVSHELKTPLSTIELATSMLKKTAVSDSEKSELWALFDIEMKRLKGEVDSLLAASVASERSLQPKLEDINLGEWLNLQVQLWKNILGPKWKLNIDFDTRNKNVTANVDAQLLQMICQNLVSNSKKFSKENPQLNVSLVAFEDLSNGNKPKWSLTFSDNGRGFDPKEKKKIFRRFYRSKSQNQLPISGTGLGLYLVKSACRAMALRVSADSLGINQGARFTIVGNRL